MKKESEYLIEYNDKIRIKITDKCNMSCPFCHCEGTKKTEVISLSDDKFIKWLKQLKPYFNKIHLTGGEPTLYNNLPALCKFLKKEGYDVFLTTNLLLLNKNLLDSIRYISRINVSFHTLNPEYFRAYIGNEDKASDYLHMIKKNILELKGLIQNISINTVVSNDKNQKLDQILYFCEANKIPLKLVPDWRYFKEAGEYIVNFLKNNKFKEEKRIIKLPGSNLRIIYRRKDYVVEFKDIRSYYLDFWCKSCHMKNKCIEKFAFLRLEGNPLRFKICINKPALNCEEFEKDFWPYFRKLLKVKK